MKKNKLTTRKAVTFIFISLFLLGVALYTTGVFFYSNPDRIAKQYINLFFERNFDEVYHRTKITDSKFVSLDLLKKAMGDEEPINKENYKIRPERAGFFRVYYIGDASSDEFINMVTLIKSKNKRFHLFPEWGIVPSLIVVNDYNIIVPQQAKITIDNIPVDESYISKEDLEVVDAKQGMKCYKIPIVIGKHILHFDCDGLLEEDIELKINPSNDHRWKYTSDLKVQSEEVISSLEPAELKLQVRNAVKLLYKEIVNREDLSEFKGLFKMDAQQQYSVNNAIREIVTCASKCKTDKIKFGLIRENSNADSEIYYTVFFKDDRDNESNHEMNFYFTKEDGTWKLDRVSGRVHSDE